MTMWNIKDYDKIKKGEYKNYLGHTFLYVGRAEAYDGKVLEYWDQSSSNEVENDNYAKEDLDDDKIIMAFNYYNNFYDL